MGGGGDKILKFIKLTGNVSILSIKRVGYIKGQFMSFYYIIWYLLLLQ